MSLQIVINSSNRAGTVITTDQFPREWMKFTVIAVPYSQRKDYLTLQNRWPVLVIPKSIPEYLSSQRQWILETTEYDHVWMMDDDLCFDRRVPGTLQLKKAKEEDMVNLLKSIKYHVEKEGIPLLGISARLGNNREIVSFTDITRVSRCFCVSKDAFDEVGISIAPFEPFLMQDFFLTLNFLTNGYATRVLNEYAQADKGSNAPGGVSVYRNPQLLKKVSFFLQDKFPGIVSVRQKTTSGGWDGFEKDREGNMLRTDVVVHWKKAYRPKRSTAGLGAFLGKATS
jgi:hypothetical protein